MKNLSVIALLSVLLLLGFVLAQEGSESGSSVQLGQELTESMSIDTGLSISTETTTSLQNFQPKQNSSENNVPNVTIENVPEQPPIFFGGIIIKEIFAKDTAFFGEYIILESHVVYSGALEVVGAGQGTASKLINIQLLPGETLLITDSPEKIIFWTGKILSQSSRTLTDSGEEILLKTGAIVIDHIIYQSAPLESALYFTDIDNLGRRRFATPGTPSPNTIPDSQGSNSGSTSTGGSNTNPTNSGSNNSGGTLSGNSLTGSDNSSTGTNENNTGDLIIDSGNGSGLLCPLPTNFRTISIVEIQPFDTDQFPEYIELLIDGSFSGPLSIQGLGQGQAVKTIYLSGYEQRIIITDEANFFSPSTDTIVLSSISLTDDGEQIQIIGQSGHVLDTAVYTRGIEGKSLYFSGLSDENIFSHTDFSSPGFDLSQVSHLFFDSNFTQFYSCSIDLQHDETFFAGRKINLIASTNNRQIQNNNNNFSCAREFPETNFSFTGCNPGFYDYLTGGLFPITLEITDLTTLQVCQTTLTLNYPLDPTEGKTCKETYYNELYLKRKGKFEYLKKGLGSFGLTANATGDISQKGLAPGQQMSTLTGKIQILSILPNPAGKDDNQEQITLQNNDTVSYPFTDLVLFNGKSKKKFPPETPQLLPGQPTTITATLGLTNRPTCVKLQDKQTIFSTFCYPEAKDDQLFTVSTDGLQAVAAVDPKLLSQITVALEEAQVCALFDKQQVVCKALRFADSIVKEYKTQAKKAVSLEKKLLKEQTRVESYKNKYDDTRAKRAEDKKQFTAKTKSLRVVEEQLRTQIRLLQGYNYLIIDELESNRLDLYLNSPLPKIRSLYSNLLTRVKSNKSFGSERGVELPAEDIELIYTLTEQGDLPLQSTELTNFYQTTVEKSKQSVDDLLKNLTIGSGVDPPGE